MEILNSKKRKDKKKNKKNLALVTYQKKNIYIKFSIYFEDQRIV
jgi:hypothetical protein